MRILAICCLMCVVATAEAKRPRGMPSVPNMPPVLVDDRPVVKPVAPPCSPECTCGCNEGHPCQCNAPGALMRAWRAKQPPTVPTVAIPRVDARYFSPMLAPVQYRGGVQNCGPGG